MVASGDPVKFVKTTLATVGLMLAAAACGGIDAPDTSSSASAIGGDTFDVDIVGQSDLYTRLHSDGHADFALQLASGEWIEGRAQLQPTTSGLQGIDDTVAADFAKRLYAELSGVHRPLVSHRYAYMAACEDEETDCDTSSFTYVIFGAEPHKPAGAEPHRDAPDPRDDDEAEPHSPKPQAEPHLPSMFSAEPH